jgi:RNA polymerase sigma-70 factor (ECF subfamily)
LQSPNKQARFEQTILPHLHAAYNLARWLTSTDQDAEDVVQEAYLRAFKFFDTFHGGDSRAWLLTIVRHTAYTWLRQNRDHELAASFDDEQYDAETVSESSEEVLLDVLEQQLLREAIAALPVEFREVIVLNALEDLSYKEIAVVVNIPIGTVMSRLARARKRLYHTLSQSLNKE